MSVANLNLQNLWANPLATQNALSTPSSGIGGSQQGSALFANLVESLNSQSAVTNTASAAPSGVSNAQISTDLEAFMQSLRQALAVAQNSGNPSASTTTGIGNSSGMVHHHHGHGHGNINSLIQDLSGNSSSANGTVGTSASDNSSSSGSSALTNLNSAFNQLMTDLGAAANTRTSGQLVNTAA